MPLFDHCPNVQQILAYSDFFLFPENIVWINTTQLVQRMARFTYSCTADMIPKHVWKNR